MGRLVKISVVDGSGHGVAGKTLIAGGAEIKTGASGLAQVLLDDGDTVITMNDIEVYRGPAEALRATEIVTVEGQRRM